MKKIKYLSLLLSTLLLTASLPALASETGKPHPWQVNLQEAVSPTAFRIGDFHDMLLVIIFAISIFVLLLLIWVVIRYNSKMNPKPSQFTHNVLLEVLWTGIPVIVLIIIAIPSFKLLYYADRVENPDMTLKIVGRQWYWDYEYPDHGDIAFSSYMIADEDIDKSKGQERLLSTDTKIVLPIETNIALHITAGDVIHAWTVPAFGVKLDAIPGRLNETWVRIEKEGVYYGQCSELCGKDHAYMPIEVHAVSKEKFEQWISVAKDDIDAAQEMDLLTTTAVAE